MSIRKLVREGSARSKAIPKEVGAKKDLREFTVISGKTDQQITDHVNSTVKNLQDAKDLLAKTLQMVNRLAKIVDYEFK